MTNDADEIQKKLFELQQAYAGQLRGRVEELATVIAAALDTKGDARASALTEILNQSHKLVGSGATFGFPTISTVAREIETACDQTLAGGDEISLLSVLDPLVVRLREAAEIPGQDTAASESDEIERIAAEGVIPGEDIKSVVILDGDDELRRQMQVELEHFGFEVRAIAHIGELETVIVERKPDALVTGLIFNGEDGESFDTLGRLHDAAQLDFPVIVHSHLDSVEARLAAVRAGAAAYLVKPIDMADLIDAVDNVVVGATGEPYRVLVVDDDESLARHTELVLQGAGMTTRLLTSPMGMLGVLEDFMPELILLDLYMPECSGQEMAAVIRHKAEFDAIPIVFLSGESDKDKQLSAMELGGDDFLTKPIQPSHLISSVRIRAERFRELRALMVRDSMTGLYNHTTTKQLLANEIARAERVTQPMVLASLDIDHFKNVNDTYGHAVGDRVIISLARLLKQRLRGADIIGRMGGEEFAAALPGANLDEAETILGQIRQAFSEIVFRTDGQSFSVTLSCGIAELKDYPKLSDLSDAADKALYVAKNGGRNLVVRADADSD